MAQWRAAARGVQRPRVDGDPEPVRESREVVEDADDVRDLEAVLVTVAERPQPVPVRSSDVVGVQREPVGDVAQRTGAWR
jgi:hypothetical protein